MKSDVVFVVDSSGSIGEANFEGLKFLVNSLVEEMLIPNCGFRIGVTTFSSGAVSRVNLNAYTENIQLVNAIYGLNYMHGQTHTADGLRNVREQMFATSAGDREDVRNIAVLITDGNANIRAESVNKEARRAMDAGIHIVPVGITNTAGEGYLDSMASAGPSGAIYADSWFDISTGTLREKILAPIFDGGYFMK